MILDGLNELYRNGTKGWLMAPEEKFALEACILEAGDGDYLEIGVNRGGSLAFAGLIKRHLKQGGSIYGIENGLGWKPEIEKLMLGLGLPYKVFYQNSHPFPAGDIKPVVSFIDGDHEGDAPINDWNNVKDITKRFILFHDCNEGSPVEKAVENAKTESDWRLVTMSGNMAVFERA
ncbi:MAG: hypothetical protein WC935_00320 [Thermoleophilia bacterium]